MNFTLNVDGSIFIGAQAKMMYQSISYFTGLNSVSSVEKFLKDYKITEDDEVYFLNPKDKDGQNFCIKKLQ